MLLSPLGIGSGFIGGPQFNSCPFLYITKTLTSRNLSHRHRSGQDNLVPEVDEKLSPEVEFPPKAEVKIRVSRCGQVRISFKCFIG